MQGPNDAFPQNGVGNNPGEWPAGGGSQSYDAGQGIGAPPEQGSQGFFASQPYPPTQQYSAPQPGTWDGSQTGAFGVHTGAYGPHPGGSPTGMFPSGYAPVPTQRKWPAWATWLVVAGAAAVIVVVILGVVFATTKDSGGPSGAVDTFTAHGTLQDHRGRLSGSRCTDRSDKYTYPLSEGDEVLISDSSGKDLAVGQVKFERSESSSSSRGYCTFSFQIEGVPSGESIYRIQIDGVNAPRASEKELREGVSLEIGK